MNAPLLVGKNGWVQKKGCSGSAWNIPCGLDLI